MDLNGEKNGRVAILFHRMGPYHFARLRAAGKVLAITLVEIFKEDKVYGWNPVLGADCFERLTLFEKEPQPVRELVAAIHSRTESLPACGRGDSWMVRNRCFWRYPMVCHPPGAGDFDVGKY